MIYHSDVPAAAAAFNLIQILQVIGAFVTASALTVLASLLGLFLDLKRPQPIPHPGMAKPVAYNRVDDRWTEYIDRLHAKYMPTMKLPYGQDFWFQVFYRFALSLSDTQLVSGLAVISTALIRMATGELSTYHFNIIQDLAWLSNNSHLLSLHLIRAWIEQQEQSHPASTTLQARHASQLGAYFGLRMTRFVLMSVMLALMLTIVIFSGSRWMYSYFECPASCTAFRWPGSTSEAGGSPQQWMITNIVLLSWAYSSTMVYLLGPTAESWRQVKHAARPVLVKLDRRLLDGLQYLWDFFGSTLFESAFQITWFGLGVHWLTDDWRSGQRLLQHPADIPGYLDCEPIMGGEAGWGFGQVFPLFMLLLPLMTLLEAFEDEKRALPPPASHAHCGKFTQPRNSLHYLDK
ncbi:uncharacterized protein HMPREF1541_10533 [Cyphellophora europaea CBS 101466]|uniref:Uncharacterized protein n=1 Tax=Cyphellophora europaea (strain CBS 101466) TaxID=1220924 RepID=W2S8I3_CYPE1|nr:uncharacterized protein HMPREF1541_10533 [Cyphellophora europaea CBS 101466]ETN44353.1 hypothetical protein HMPREF1541_10533 [Cyphellophora europaea CBS 101466]